MLAIGATLQGRYTIQATLGQGGYGAVYQVYHDNLRKPMAIKEVLFPNDPRFVRRFAEEAELLAKMRHKALPAVTDYFQENACSYLVMEFVPGEDLGTFLRRQPNSMVFPETALKIISPVLEAIAYLHTQNPPIIHRDIKPANIRLTPEGNVYLVDFGIAKMYAPDQQTTEMSRAITPGYSPFEQYSNDMSTDARSDIYALGATLYYMLSGVIPPDAPNRVRVDPMEPLSDMNPAVSPYLQTIITTMLAVWPDDRYQDIATLHQALTANEQDLNLSLDTSTSPTSSDLQGGDAIQPVGDSKIPPPTQSIQPTTHDPKEIISRLKPDAIVEGHFFDEPVRVIVTQPIGDSIKLIGTGTRTRQTYEPVLSSQQLAQLIIAPETEPFDGDAQRFRLGIEAMRLGLAYEYDRYFSLSIARVDPLPHQLEAVYDYFLKLPRIRFLLADDPGAGKTIMAGLLIKELKIRGLIKRVLIVTPANLTFQWQREMQDRFREKFDIIGSEILRSVYGANPWQDYNQVITSISWVSRIEDAKESILRSQWDLVIVDEAHKMSAYSEDKKTLAYQFGEALAQQTDHYLLMTATPHKGDPQNFCLFLKLLDADVYADVSSLQAAMEQHEAPFYLRRVKEALVTFPHPETGEVRTLFTRRNVQTISFNIDDDEWDFYDKLTSYVEDQSIKAAADDSARGRALGFTMAMLQRRFASSIYAARRSLERMKERRERILSDPQAYRQEQIQRKMPDDFSDLPDEEQQEVLDYLESVVASVDPVTLREEIQELSQLVDHALHLEQREIETKLRKLREVLHEQGMFDDPKMKLLIFTEHKDTLDYLVTKLEGWKLNVTQIQGGMKIGDRDKPGTRIYAEREFRETAQVMVATEAAGEGINLQFCWFLINYDIPWNPMRLEQRMGRIHRYGQEKDCLILNFVSIRTREGRVLDKLFERIAAIERDLDPDRTGKIFNVLGDVLPSNQLERMLRDMYAHNLTDQVIINRIVEQVDTERFANITSSALEGLAKRELNLASILNKTAEAKERRLVPEVIRDFFLEASPLVGVQIKQNTRPHTVYRIAKIPRSLLTIGEELEPRFGQIGREYSQITFEQQMMKADPTLEWVTPGHPLFESVRVKIEQLAQTDLQQGAVFYDLHRKVPACLHVYSAAIQDGRGNILHRRLYVLDVAMDGTITVRQPTIFLDLSLAPKGTPVPDIADLPPRSTIEQTLYEHELIALQQEVQQEREQEIATIERHIELSLKTLIDRQSNRYAELWNQQQAGDTSNLMAANLKLTEDRLEELNARLNRRSAEIQQERHCTITDIQQHGRAWVLPHPQRTEPTIAPMVRDDEIEHIAIAYATAYEEQRGWQVKSVEKDNRGFDLISNQPLDLANTPQCAVDHNSDTFPATQTTHKANQVRFIEVKGRSTIGEVGLTANEYKTAQRLGNDYWLYVVYHCTSKPQLHIIQNPAARLGWEAVVTVEHYRVGAKEILGERSEE